MPANQGYLPNQGSTLTNKQSFKQKAYGNNQARQGQGEQEKKSNSIFEDPMDESRYLKFLMKEKYKLFENEDQIKQRSSVLKTIEVMVNQWQINIAVKTKKMLPEEAQSKPARVVSFGSYKIGAHFPETDLDLICVLPTYISQDEFFGSFKQLLLNTQGVDYVIDVIDAKIPILKTKMLGYQVDLLYSAIDPNVLATQQSIDKVIKDEQFFNKLNSISQNSLNGLMTSLNLLKSVPNVPKFRNTLRAIKMWAMRRCIYSNTLGYLGGVSYAIMVAKICQDYPDLELPDLLNKFFIVFSEWKCMDPVSIKVGKKKEKLNINALQALESYSDDLMPILTPTSNPKNSAYRVCQSTFDIISRELVRARLIVAKVAPRSQKRKSSTLEQENEEIKTRKYSLDNVIQIQRNSVKWTKLFKKLRFFSKFEHFIKIDVLSSDDEAHMKWLGYVETQLRRLIQLLGDLEQIQELRIYPKAFTREETKDTINKDFKCCDAYFIGLKVQQTNPGQKIDLRNSVINFCNFLEIGRVQKQVNNDQGMQVDTPIDCVQKQQKEGEEEEEDEKNEQAEKRENQFKLKTRRQSKGLCYFNRLNPNIQITIGTLEDWCQDKSNVKRRKINEEEKRDMSVDAITQHTNALLDDTIEIHQDKLNKSLLHEEWLKDFEEEQKKRLKAQKMSSKKRKRADRSRSPTPQKPPSVASKSVKSKKSATPQVSENESEEDRKETEKMKNEILQLLEKKGEPLTMLQISYTTKYSKKYCDEVMLEFIKEGKVKTKEISKNNAVFFIPFECTLDKKEQLDLLQLRMEEIIDIEKKESRMEKEVNEVEKKIKNLKITPTTKQVEEDIKNLQVTLEELQKETDTIQQRPDFLGEKQYKETQRSQEQLNRLKETYIKRKQGCIDMLEQLSDQFNEDFSVLVDKIGLDKEEIANEDEIMKILDLYQEKSQEKEEESEEEEFKGKKKAPKRTKTTIKDATDEDDEEGDDEILEEEEGEVKDAETQHSTAKGNKKMKIDKRDLDDICNQDQQEGEETQQKYSQDDF